jgi:monothiol glutaredoxin
VGLDATIQKNITSLIEGSPVVLFMKGNREAPQCGFSARVIRILDAYLSDYETIDVLANADIREGIKVFSSWPTIPQLYIGGEFVGGCDIITEMTESGELFKALGMELPPEVIPRIEISDNAARALEQARMQTGEAEGMLRLSINGSWQAGLSVENQTETDVRVEANGISLILDRISAPRADGVSIDLVENEEGRGFTVDNPNAPTLGEMSVRELQELLVSGEEFRFIDVRTEREYEAAHVEGSTLLDQSEYEKLMKAPRSTKIVLMCHHGPRGVNTGTQFVQRGFSNVFNVVGGIDAWSLEIDSSIPRY